MLMISRHVRQMRVQEVRRSWPPPQMEHCCGLKPMTIASWPG